MANRLMLTDNTSIPLTIDGIQIGDYIGDRRSLFINGHVVEIHADLQSFEVLLPDGFCDFIPVEQVRLWSLPQKGQQ